MKRAALWALAVLASTVTLYVLLCVGVLLYWGLWLFGGAR